MCSCLLCCGCCVEVAGVMRTVPWDERMLRVVHGDGIMSETFERVLMTSVFWWWGVLRVGLLALCAGAILKERRISKKWLREDPRHDEILKQTCEQVVVVGTSCTENLLIHTVRSGAD